MIPHPTVLLFHLRQRHTASHRCTIPAPTASYRIPPFHYPSFNSVINALGMAGLWKEALGVMDEMVVDGGVTPNSVTYASAINACGNSRQLDRALGLLREARLAGIEVRKYRFKRWRGGTPPRLIVKARFLRDHILAGFGNASSRAFRGRIRLYPWLRSN